MFLLRPPGVYRPQDDTDLLAEALTALPLTPGSRVLDVGTGTGALAVAAARIGAGEVTALDVSRRAVSAAWLNARLRRVPVRVRRGEAPAAASRGPFELVLANPPYVPWPGTGRRVARWDAGADGRAVLDPLCETVPELLAWHGSFLLVQSALSGVDATLAALRDRRLVTTVPVRRRVPFGPVLCRRRDYLEGHGLVRRGQREEELVVIRADRREQPG